MESTQKQLNQIIKEEIAKANLNETNGDPGGYKGGSYPFHDPDNIHVRNREDMYDAGPEGPEMLPIDPPSEVGTITIVGVDGDGDTFARKTSLEDIKNMSSMGEVLEYLQNKLRIPIYGLSSKSVRELKAVIEQDDSASGY